MHKRQQTETTNNQEPHTTLFSDILTYQKDRTIFNQMSKTRQFYDSIDFVPHYNIGISSDVIHINDDEEVTYISGNHYCTTSTFNNNKMVCIQRKSKNGQIKKMFLRKTKKLNLLSSLELIKQNELEYAHIHIYNKITTVHKNINIRCLGNIIDLYILAEGKLGLLLVDQKNENQQKFGIYMFNIEKQSVVLKFERMVKPLKLVSSNFGDFSMILTNKIDTYNQKLELSQFELKKYLDPNQICVDANFLKNTIKLVIITNKSNILFFQGRILTSKRQIKFPIKHTLPFEQLQYLQNELVQKIQYQQLSQPLNIQTSDSQVIILFRDNKIGLLSFQGKQFNFQTKYDLPTQQHKNKIIKNIKFINGDIYIMFKDKGNCELWKIVKKGNLQENYHICKTISQFSYINAPKLVSLDFCQTNKLLFTVHDDKCLRIWNFQSNLQFYKYFFQFPTCITINPFGLHIIVSFKQFTKIYLVKQYDIQLIYTLKIKNISSVKYQNRGNRIAISQNHNIHILNAYTFNTIISFQIQINNITELKLIGEQIFIKNDQQFCIYNTTNGKKIINQTKAICSDIQSSDLIYSTEKQRIYYRFNNFQQQMSFNISNLNLNQKITCIKLIPLLGIVIIGTSEGNLLQFICPFFIQQDGFVLNYKYKAGTSGIKQIHCQETFKNIVIVTENNLIINLKMVQYIQGQIRQGIYVFTNQKNEMFPDKLKRTLINRTYFLDRYVQISNLRMYEKNELLNETQFLKNHKLLEVIELKQKNQSAIKDILNKKKINKQQIITKQQNEFQNYVNLHKLKIENHEKDMKNLQKNFNQKKQQQQQFFQKKLLKLIQKSQQLKKTQSSQTQKLTKIINQLSTKNHQIVSKLKKQKQNKYNQLIQKFSSLINKVKTDQQIMTIIDQDQDQQAKIFKKAIDDQLNLQIQQQQNRRNQLNGEIIKKQKDLANFKLRAKHMQSLIVETNKQIDRLQQDQKQYKQRANQMTVELKSKQQYINKKEQQLKRLWQQTNNIRNFKNIHQFMLTQYRQQIQPNQLKNIQLQTKVKSMNQQLLKQIHWRHNAQQKMLEAQQKISTFKQTLKKKMKQKFTLKTNIQDIAFNLSNLLRFISPDDWKYHLKKMLSQKFQNNELLFRLSLQIQKMSQQNKAFIQSQLLLFKNINELLKKKQQINKKIYKVKQNSKFQQKYKEQLFKKFQNQNTQLVKQYNLLLKQKKNLQEQIGIFRNSLDLTNQYIQKQHQKSSIILSAQKQIKPTPFQQYTIQQTMTARKSSSQRKTTARLNPINNSNSWLKTLIKDIDGSATKTQRFDLIKSRVKSFVNPQYNKLKIASSNHQQILNIQNNNHKKKNVIDIFNDTNGESRPIRTKSQLFRTMKIGKKL